MISHYPFSRQSLFQIEFLDGVSTAPLVITILADDIPELDETSTIRLTRIINPGTTRTDRGATISSSSSAAELRVLANDSPHGVFAWNLESLYTAVDEPEGSQGSRSVTMYMTREQGFTGVVNVYYRLVSAVTECLHLIYWSWSDCYCKSPRKGSACNTPEYLKNGLCFVIHLILSYDSPFSFQHMKINISTINSMCT